MGGHQFGRLVAFGAAGVPDPVVVHPKTATHKIKSLRRGSGHVIGILNASPSTLHLSAGGKATNAGLGQRGVGLTQLHDSVASKPLQGIFL